MSIFIYYLSDEKGNIRYVGKTKNSPRKRLYKHILESKRDNRTYKTN
jgi:excinuclease UvrABC nuclease subunit